MRSFLFGIFLGAIAGVLYAPTGGNRTRSIVRDKFTRYRNETVNYLDSKSRDLSNRMEGVKHKYSGAMEEAKEQAGKLQDVVQSKMTQAKEQMDQVRDKVQDSVKQAEQRRSA
jgi:gas vesicle protein